MAFASTCPKLICMNPQSIWWQGGPLLWLLALLGLLSFFIALERAIYLHRGHLRSVDFLTGVKNLLRRRRLLEALTVCEEAPGPIPAMVKAALLRLQEGDRAMRQAVETAALIHIPLLERRLASLGIIARLAPLIGLIGTLLALVEQWSRFSGPQPVAYPTQGAILAALAQAVLTTLAGLMVAAFAHCAYYFLAARVRALVQEMEFIAHELLQFLTARLPEETEADPAEAADAEGGPVPSTAAPFVSSLVQATPVQARQQRSSSELAEDPAAAAAHS